MQRLRSFGKMRPLASLALVAGLAVAGGVCSTAGAQVQVLFSNVNGDGFTIPPDPTAIVPTIGGGTLTFAPNAPLTTIFATPGLSQDGRRWIMRARIAGTSTTDSEILLAGIGTSGTTLLRRGDPFPDTTPGIAFGELVGVIDEFPGINNAGIWTASTRNTNQPSTSDRVMLRGGPVTPSNPLANLTLFAREGTTVPGQSFAYGGTLTKTSVTTDGRPVFLMQTSGNAGKHALLRGYEGTPDVLAQTDSGPNSSPIGSAAVYDLFFADQLSIDRDGSRWITVADMNPTNIVDTRLIVSNQIVTNVGASLPGGLFAGTTISAFKATTMNPAGQWLARGINTGPNTDWVLLNGNVYTSSGQDTYPSSPEKWADGLYSETFLGIAQNCAGDIAVAGGTDLLGWSVVLNGQRQILHSGDPITIGTGSFTLSALIADAIGLSSDGWLYASVTIADTAGTGGPTNSAFIRVRAFCPGDHNRNGPTDVPDIFAYLSDFFAQNPKADLDCNGVIEVPDIFAFLSAWFAPCP